MAIFSFVKPGKQIFKTITSVKPSKNIKEFTKHKEDVAKSTEKYTKGLTEEDKINVRKGTSRVLSKISKILKREKKMGGGMMGRRFGMEEGGKAKKPFKITKDNIEKIKEAMKKRPQNQRPPKREMYKKGSKKFPDLTGDGKVTFADILKGRGVINGKKKKA